MTDSPDLGVERTLVLLKPDAVARGLAGRILTRFEDAAAEGGGREDAALGRGVHPDELLRPEGTARQGVL